MSARADVILGLDTVADPAPYTNAQRLADIAFPRPLYVPPAVGADAGSLGWLVWLLVMAVYALLFWPW